MGQFEESDEKSPQTVVQSECRCCFDEKDQSGQSIDDKQPSNQSVNQSVDQSVDQSINPSINQCVDHVICHQSCAACCQQFDHQYCSDPVACRNRLTNQSIHQSINQSIQHDHSGIRKRFVYKPVTSKSQVFSLASPSTTQSTNQLIDESSNPSANQSIDPSDKPVSIYQKLSFIDRFLSLWILITMIVGVLIGYYSSDATDRLQSVHLGSTSVSLPVAFGLWFMMWPVLVKVKYEAFGKILQRRDIWKQLAFSLLANWVIGPFLMLGAAWACLPDLDAYRNGVIMVGLARCVAMVLIWNELAAGDPEYCAMLVAVNSVMQIALYAPLALFFLVVISGQYSGEGESLSLNFWDVFESVLLFLGVPLVAAIVTRYVVIKLAGRKWFDEKFVPFISPLALIALLWTVFVVFVIQGHNIVNNIGDVCRVAVPMILYFLLMFVSSLAMCRHFGFGYERSVTQAFTASSNNFELAIAVAAATFGADSKEALAATIGPLVEVPILLALVYVALWLKPLISWPTAESSIKDEPAKEIQLTQCPL